MANPSALPNQDPGSDAGAEQVWLTAGEAADAANVTHSQVATWVAAGTLSSRMGWRGGAEIQLVLLSDLESLAEHVDLDCVRGSLAERGVFTGPRRVVLGGFRDESGAKTTEPPASGQVVVKAAHQIRVEDRVWASELDGEVRRLRQVIRTLRDDHESLERHLDFQSTKPHGTPTSALDSESVEANAVPPIGASLAADEPATGMSSGAMLAIACGVVLGMIGAAIIFPGAKTMASEKLTPEGVQADAEVASAMGPPAATAGLSTQASSEADAELAIRALEAMDEEFATVEVDALATPGGSLIASASFGGAFTEPQGTSATSPTGEFFAGFLDGDPALSPSGITGTEQPVPAPIKVETPTMGPELAQVAANAVSNGAAVSGPVEASARLDAASAAKQLAEDMLVEPPPLKPRARGAKPNSLGAPKRLRVPMALAELDRTLFARRSALLSDCAYTELVNATHTGDGPSSALVLGPCFGPTRAGQSGAVAAPGTHRVGSVACCRHHAFVERLTSAANDEAARVGLRAEAELALREGIIPPFFRLRANRSATRFVREETRGWTSAGLDGIAGATQSDDAVHEWKLSENQPGAGSIRVELRSWIQPVVPFDAAKFESASVASKSEGMRRFHMTILVQAAPDGDVLEGFEWLTD